MEKIRKGEHIICDRCKGTVKNGVYSRNGKLYCSKTCVNKAAKDEK